MTAEEVAKRWPFAVQSARVLRDVFGPEVKLTYATNEAGEVLGKPDQKAPKLPTHTRI